jgi:hypothetical protein
MSITQLRGVAKMALRERATPDRAAALVPGGVDMSGLTHTGGVVGTTVLGTKIVNGTLPFTGAAVGIYLVVAFALLVTGVVFTIVGRSRPEA